MQGIAQALHAHDPRPSLAVISAALPWISATNPAQFCGCDSCGKGSADCFCRQTPPSCLCDPPCGQHPLPGLSGPALRTLRSTAAAAAAWAEDRLSTPGCYKTRAMLLPLHCGCRCALAGGFRNTRHASAFCIPDVCTAASVCSAWAITSMNEKNSGPITSLRGRSHWLRSSTLWPFAISRIISHLQSRQ